MLIAAKLSPLEDYKTDMLALRIIRSHERATFDPS